MRVADKSIYQMIRYNLGRISQQVNRASQTVATGRRISGLADDPAGLVQTLKIDAALSGMEQVGRNLGLGKSWLAASEGAMTRMQELVAEARALSVQMATDTTTPAQRIQAAVAVQNALEEMVSLANRSVNGRYIFAGSRTDAAPFGPDGTYNGDHTPFAIMLGKGTTLEVGSDGEALFRPAGKDIFQILTDLKTALQNNDLGGIQEAINRLDEYHEHLGAHISEVGFKTRRLELKEKIYQDLKVSQTARRSEIADADMAEAILRLKAIEVSYQAALSSSARIMGLNLVDYLK